MEYVKVESSQIDSVGYLPDVPKPGIGVLGIRFKSKSGLTEYHYGKITPEMYREMMEDKSIGTYFGRVIKPFPDKYPFMKVEADPTQPSATTSQTDATNGTEDSATTDTPSPGSALALIDGMADDLLFTPGKITDDQLATMRSDWLAEAKKFDISTEAKRAALKRFARPLQKLRTGIDARAKELTGKMKRFVAGIDGEKRRLVQAVGSIEDEVLAPWTAWEQEEDSRKARLAGEVSRLAGYAQTYHPDILTLTAEIAELESFDTSTMQEYKVSAESAIAASLKVLKPELERRKVAEAERAELETLRAAKAKQDEDARIAAAAQVLADKQTQERLDAAVEAAKVETRQEVIAELQAESGEPEDGDNEVSEPLENAGYYPEAPGIVYPVPAPPLTHETHEQHINAQAVEALMGCALTRHEAMAVLTAIVEGRIPHITITY